MSLAKVLCTKAPARFELAISCLLDRRFNQLSHGAVLLLPSLNFYPFQKWEGRGKIFVKKFCAQRGARTHDPEIKSLMLYRLS